MAGSSGRRFYSPSRVAKPASSVDINGCLRDQLRDYNDRDAEAIRTHIRVLRDALEQELDDVIRPMFGGSISRHTYVDGLSDVDVLMVINDSTLVGQSPKVAIQHMAALIRQRMPNSNVTVGKLAVTVKYADGTELQLLPAIRTKSGIRISEPDRNTWSRIVQPERFAQKLTQVNQANQGGVIPTIKLLKALSHHTVRSDRGRLSSYHIESLAIEVFKNHRGSRDYTSMIGKFLQQAPNLVRNPIRDSTGQSRFVDEYLGSVGSSQRRDAIRTLNLMKQRFDKCHTEQDVKTLFQL